MRSDAVMQKWDISTENRQFSKLSHEQFAANKNKTSHTVVALCITFCFFACFLSFFFVSDLILFRKLCFHKQIINYTNRRSTSVSSRRTEILLTHDLYFSIYVIDFSFIDSQIFSFFFISRRYCSLFDALSFPFSRWWLSSLTCVVLFF